MTMVTAFVFMKDGIIQQVADPISLYNNPSNKFVAGFIGTPPMNFFDGRLEEKDGKMFFVEETFSIELTDPEWKKKVQAANVTDVTFGIRPEDIGSETAEQNPDFPRIKAKIEVIEPMGAETHIYLNTGKHNFIATIEPLRKVTYGEVIELSVSAQSTPVRNDTEEAIF